MSITSTLRSLVWIAFFLMVAAFPRNSIAQYAGWTVGDARDDYGTILRTTDSGSTWTRQGVAGQIADVDLQGVVAVDPFTAWVVGYADRDNATIYRTTDGGDTWEWKGFPTDIPDLLLTKVHAVDDDRVWAVGTNAILHSSDGGATWTNQLPAGYEDIGLQGVYTPDGVNVWVTGGPKDGYATILKSDDGGASWTRQSGGDVNLVDHLLGISAVDARTAWAVGGGPAADPGHRALHTTNGGITWKLQTGFLGWGDANEVDALSDSIVWSAVDEGVLWSTDGGKNWDDSGSHGHSTGLATMGISAVSSEEAWSVVYSYPHATEGTTGAIWHTADGGITWEEQGPEDLPGLWTVSFSVPEPSTLVQEILDFIDDSVEAGTLEGSGPGNSGDGRLNALTNMMETAADLIEDRHYDGAYHLVEQAHRRCDGLSSPPDFVEGEARGTLAEMTADLMAILLPLR